MKFSEVNEKMWEDLRPYVDTCLLPVTGLSGSELPWEATCALEDLRDALDLFEIPYKGRVLTYPAFHYAQAAGGVDSINEICSLLRKSGFSFVITISAKAEMQEMLAESAADLSFVFPPSVLTESLQEQKKRVASQLMKLWSNMNK